MWSCFRLCNIKTFYDFTKTLYCILYFCILKNRPIKFHELNSSLSILQKGKTGTKASVDEYSQIFIRHFLSGPNSVKSADHPLRYTRIINASKKMIRALKIKKNKYNWPIKKTKTNTHTQKILVWHSHKFLLPYITVEEYFIIYFTFIFNL